jgi:hypothetical protein
LEAQWSRNTKDCIVFLLTFHGEYDPKVQMNPPQLEMRMTTHNNQPQEDEGGGGMRRWQVQRDEGIAAMVTATNNCKQELARREEAEEEEVHSSGEDRGRGGLPCRGLQCKDRTPQGQQWSQSQWPWKWATLLTAATRRGGNKKKGKDGRGGGEATAGADETEEAFMH